MRLKPLTAPSARLSRLSSKTWKPCGKPPETKPPSVKAPHWKPAARSASASVVTREESRSPSRLTPCATGSSPVSMVMCEGSV
jgi:hypothetical protein